MPLFRESLVAFLKKNLITFTPFVRMIHQKNSFINVPLMREVFFFPLFFAREKNSFRTNSCKSNCGQMTLNHPYLSSSSSWRQRSIFDDELDQLNEFGLKSSSPFLLLTVFSIPFLTLFHSKGVSYFRLWYRLSFSFIPYCPDHQERKRCFILSSILLNFNLSLKQ